MAYSLTLRAQLDLGGIAQDLGAKNPQAYQRYEQQFLSSFERLAEMPELGQVRPEVHSEMRHWVIAPYIVFYRIVSGDVQIVRVLDGRRKLTPELFE